MTRQYSLLLATAIFFFIVVYAYDPRYVVAYVAILAIIIYSIYAMSHSKHHGSLLENSQT